MKRLCLLLVLCLTGVAFAQEPKPLRALMFVGGCCHDYKEMPVYLTQKIGGLANVTFDIRPMADAQLNAHGVR